MTRGRRVAVVGSGLAGLVAARAVAEHGGEPTVFERADHPGGTTALSSGWIWRYRDLATLQWAAPTGDRVLQELVWELLPDAIIWLERLGVRLVGTGTRNPLTDGVRIDPSQAIDRLAGGLPDDALVLERTVVAIEPTSGGVDVTIARDGDRLESDRRTERFDNVVLAGGGYAADEQQVALDAHAPADAIPHWQPRHGGGSDGTTIAIARAQGAQLTGDIGEFYARAMPARVDADTARPTVAGADAARPMVSSADPARFVDAVQFYARHATVIDALGRSIAQEPNDWADVRIVWELARRTGRGWYVVERSALDEQTPYGTVRSAVAAARAAGGEVFEGDGPRLFDALVDRGVDPQTAARSAIERSAVAVSVGPGITHTIGGIAVDARARVVGVPMLCAAGVDVGGLASGGYTSGLAQALVLGRLAADQ